MSEGRQQDSWERAAAVPGEVDIVTSLGVESKTFWRELQLFLVCVTQIVCKESLEVTQKGYANCVIVHTSKLTCQETSGDTDTTNKHSVVAFKRSCSCIAMSCCFLRV